MAAKKRTISIRLDAEAEARLSRAASIAHQSRGAFLQSAGEARARQVLLSWAVDRYREGDTSFSALAAATGLAVEEIMSAIGHTDRAIALEQFLASCRSVAEATATPSFLTEAQSAVAGLAGR